MKETAVAAKTDRNNNQYLCAYVVLETENEINQAEIKGFLSKELPDYMVPSYVVTLDELPLTPNGKVDVKALPEPDVKAAAKAEYEPPGNELEAKIASIWEDILSIKPISVNANLFDIGANS
ncbi:hypothetical protein QKW52_20160 [Bacillus sonorensis]|nr:hypothetical protein [Bacillus sonorensis]